MTNGTTVRDTVAREEAPRMPAGASRQRILVVDDDEKLLRLLAIQLKRASYEVETVASAERALACLPTFRPDAIVTDLRMEGIDGMGLFERVHERHPGLPVIVLTAHGTIPEAVGATKRGVFAFLTKPFDGEELLDVLQQALRTTGSANASKDWCDGIITRSEAMEALFEQAARAARSDSSVLVIGQSGTGKELVARAIHRASTRRAGPFVAINCTAVPESLLESELFGHSKGSFTGADRGRPGLLQAANGGTLFLDEIGDMPLGFQARLLRALEEREVRPVGTTTPIKVDIRVISATHRDLRKAVEAGEFREDLYYRLNVILLEVPPLADRREDIPLLVRHFLAQMNERGFEHVTGFSSEAMERLMSAPWPGNVRQLRNVVERCAVLCSSAVIPATLVDKALEGTSGELLSLSEARDRFEREYLLHLLQMTEGNVSQAARLADRNRSDFYKLLRKHQLDPMLFRGAGSEAEDEEG
jgi:two-component system, NtrC family, response regulator GlrR